MNIKYKREIFSIFLTLIILLLFLMPGLSFNYYSYFTFPIYIKNIIAILFFIIIIILKDEKKINMIVFLDRFNKKELYYSYTHYGIIFTLFILMNYLNYLNILILMIIILLEVLIMITLYYMAFNKKLTRDINMYIKVKEVIYICLMLILFLNNYPFEIYNIPMNNILAILYIVVQFNILYKLNK